MFGLYRLNQQRFPTLGLMYKVRFIQDSVLFVVQFRQVSLYDIYIGELECHLICIEDCNIIYT